MRSFLIGGLAALAFAASAHALTPGSPSAGPYHLDTGGYCRGTNAQLVLASKCHTGPSCTRTTKRCGSTCIPRHKRCHVAGLAPLG